MPTVSQPRVKQLTIDVCIVDAKASIWSFGITVYDKLGKLLKMTTFIR